MKVFLTAIPEVDSKLLTEIHKILTGIGGPIEYQDLGVTNLTGYLPVIPEIKDALEADEFDFSTVIKFGTILKFKRDIPHEDILVLLTKKRLGTPIKEFKTWFSYFDRSYKRRMTC